MHCADDGNKQDQENTVSSPESNSPGISTPPAPCGPSVVDYTNSGSMSPLMEDVLNAVGNSRLTSLMKEQQGEKPENRLH
jgi:hypothetical protein